VYTSIFVASHWTLPHARRSTGNWLTTPLMRVKYNTTLLWSHHCNHALGAYKQTSSNHCVWSTICYNLHTTSFTQRWHEDIPGRRTHWALSTIRSASAPHLRVKYDAFTIASLQSRNTILLLPNRRHANQEKPLLRKVVAATLTRCHDLSSLE